MTLYVKIGAGLALILALFLGGWYCGSLGPKARMAELESRQSASLSTALAAQALQARTEQVRLNGIIASYENLPVDPIAVSIGSRVYHYAATACHAVPSAAANPSGIEPASPVSSGSGEIEQALNELIKAGSHDSTLMLALKAAWPQ